MPDLSAYDPSYLDTEDQPQTPEELAAWRAKMAAGQQAVPMPPPRSGLQVDPATFRDVMHTTGSAFGGQAQPQTEVPLPAPMRKATSATTGFTNATSPYQPQVPGVMQSLDPDAAAAVLAATQAQQKPATAGPLAGPGGEPAAKPQSALDVIGGNYYKKVPSDPNESPNPGELMQPGDVGNRYVPVAPPWSATGNNITPEQARMRAAGESLGPNELGRGTTWQGNKPMRNDPLGNLIPDARVSPEDIRQMTIRNAAEAMPGWAGSTDRDKLLLLSMAGHQQREGFQQGIQQSDANLRLRAHADDMEKMNLGHIHAMALETLKQGMSAKQFKDALWLNPDMTEPQKMAALKSRQLADQVYKDQLSQPGAMPQVPGMPGVKPAGATPATTVPGMPPARPGQAPTAPLVGPPVDPLRAKLTKAGIEEVPWPPQPGTNTATGKPLTTEEQVADLERQKESEVTQDEIRNAILAGYGNNPGVTLDAKTKRVATAPNRFDVGSFVGALNERATRTPENVRRIIEQVRALPGIGSDQALMSELGRQLIFASNVANPQKFQEAGSTYHDIPGLPGQSVSIHRTPGPGGLQGFQNWLRAGGAGPTLGSYTINTPFGTQSIQAPNEWFSNWDRPATAEWTRKQSTIQDQTQRAKVLSALLTTMRQLSPQP